MAADGLTSDEAAALDRALRALDADEAPARPDLERACRALTRLIAARVPGRSVELRVPPFAAVQIIEGQRHRRGTPPATVEISPTDWLRLATGRISWDAAIDDGIIRASGVRSDLSPYLPLLA
ncbi:MAG TPA: sterol carrier family protein [Mycobacteriales bacterium]|nr:sterol carrier family protein [Mycobacteriales bacterium]